MVDYRKMMIKFATSTLSTGTPINTDKPFMKAFANKFGEFCAVEQHSAIYITYLARMVGLSTNSFPSFIDCEYAVEWFKNHDRWYEQGGSYMPIPGDIVFIDTTMTKKAQLVGVLLSTENGKFTIAIGKSKTAGQYRVTKVSYVASSRYILGFASPNYVQNDATQLSSLVKGSYIKTFQEWMSKTYYFSFEQPGVFNQETRRAAIMAWQKEMNKHFSSCNLDITGTFNNDSDHVAKRHAIRRGTKCTNLVYILQGLLYAHGYDPKGFTGKFDSKCQNAVRAFQRARGIPEADAVRSMTWSLLFTR